MTDKKVELGEIKIETERSERGKREGETEGVKERGGREGRREGRRERG